jgi:ABC-type Fe3+/spermidine/putrescine transport system ATPase subunit
LLGPSGSGKTTLLRIIAGLEEPEAGTVRFDGRDMRGVPVHLRGFGLMFQDLALFPHRNVFENVAFGLRMQNLPRAEIEARVREILELVGLAGFETRDVNNLSGGEQQRVALARSLAPRPKLLMLDEPLGALDRILREQVIADLRVILKKIGMTTLYVTHDQDEAFALADRIAIIHDGQIVQSGTPAGVYRAPGSAFVARFLGLTNLLEGRVLADGRVETALGVLITRGGTSPAREVVVLVRDEDVRVLNEDAREAIRASVGECVFRAGKYRARVTTDAGVPLVFSSEQELRVGARVNLQIVAAEILRDEAVSLPESQKQPES